MGMRTTILVWLVTSGCAAPVGTTAADTADDTVGATGKADAQTIEVTVEVDGLRSTNGTLHLNVCASEVCWARFTDDQDDLASDPESEYALRQSLSSDALAIDRLVTTMQLPAGTYAITIFHDENDDGEMDWGWFTPDEGYGFSNGAWADLGGAPSWGDASFDVGTDVGGATIVYADYDGPGRPAEHGATNR